MSSERFNNTFYDELLEDHAKKAKRILKKDLSTNERTLKRYEIDILRAHNKIVKYVSIFLNRFDENSRDAVENEIKQVVEKTSKCIVRLNLDITLPENIFKQIDIENDTESIESIQYSDDEEFCSANSTHANLTLSNDSQSETNTIQSENTLIQDKSDLLTSVVAQHEQNISRTSPTQIDKMPDQELTKVGFIKFAAQTLKIFNGDPMALTAFENNVKMLKSLSDKKYDTELRDVILTKLEGKAYECIDPEKDVDNIVECLKTHIKHDNSKVIIGRMGVLKLNKLTTQDYAQKAEELAEALQRSLIFEGVNREKAKEMAIDKTVEMCRQSAKSDLVRSVIASTSYTSPKEVISKLITEQTTNERECQIFSFRSQSNKRFNNFASNRGRGSFQNRNGRWKNQNSNWRGNNNSYGNNGYNNGNGNGNWRNKNNRFSRGAKKNYNVRYSENGSAPADERRGAEVSEASYTLERVNLN